MALSAPARRKRKAELLARVTSSAEDHFATCTIPGCAKPTKRAARLGLAGTMCTYHVQRAARFGSPWAPQIRATDLAPYLKTALRWIEERQEDTFIAQTLRCLKGLLDGAGEAEPARNIKRRSAAFRARVAFARLREAGVKHERLLAIHMAVTAIIEDDRDSHRVREFRIVQVAKAVHRLASGTHRKWDFPMPDGSLAPLEMHVYPHSSGLVLRVMGEELEAMCDLVTTRDADAIRVIKRKEHGPHPSQMPGWRPKWMRDREAALMRG